MNTIPQNTPMKQCFDCKGWFPATIEYFPPEKKGRLKRYCRPCQSARYKKYREGRRDQLNARVKKWHQNHKEHNQAYRQARKQKITAYRDQHIGKLKQCKKCKESLPATAAYFHKSPCEKDGWYSICKKCRGQGRTFGIEPIVCQEGEKCCMQCWQVFPATVAYFHRAKYGKYGLSSRCKKCKGKGRTFGQRIIRSTKDAKQCKRCLTVFPKTSQYFYPKTSTRNDGFDSRCRTCRHELYQLYKGGINQRRREQRLRNPDLFKQQSKARYHNHREQMREQNHNNYKKHKAKRQVTAKQYRIAHRPEHNAYNRNRRALKKSIPGSHTAQDIRDLYKRQKGNCYYCRHKVPWGEHQVEHTFPISRMAGTDIPANDISYLVISCKPCNIKKGNKFPWEWVEGGRLL